MFDTANQTVETERYFNGKNEKFKRRDKWIVR